MAIREQLRGLRPRETAAHAQHKTSTINSFIPTAIEGAAGHRLGTRKDGPKELTHASPASAVWHEHRMRLPRPQPARPGSSDSIASAVCTAGCAPTPPGRRTLASGAAQQRARGDTLPWPRRGSAPWLPPRSMLIAIHPHMRARSHRSTLPGRPQRRGLEALQPLTQVVLVVRRWRLLPGRAARALAGAALRDAGEREALLRGRRPVALPHLHPFAVDLHSSSRVSRLSAGFPDPELARTPRPCSSYSTPDAAPLAMFVWTCWHGACVMPRMPATHHVPAAPAPWSCVLHRTHVCM